jgi:hypothetical protein
MLLCELADHEYDDNDDKLLLDNQPILVIVSENKVNDKVHDKANNKSTNNHNDKPSQIHSEKIKLRQCNSPECVEAKIAISELSPKLSQAIQQYGPNYGPLADIYDQMAQLYYTICDFNNSLLFTQHALRIRQMAMGFHHNTIIPMLARQGRASLHLCR